jgi:iron complex transport system permease protein
VSDDNDTAVADEVTPASIGRRPPNGLVLAGVALLWLVLMLLAARNAITGSGQAEAEVSATAYALPGVISAALTAGAAVALAVLALLTRGGRTLGPTVRLGAATATGLAIGLLAAAWIITINTEGWLYAHVGGAIAAAATIGGAVAGLRPARLIATICWAGLVVFAIAFGLNLIQEPLLDVFGAADSQASQASAFSRLSFTQSAVSGLAAGLVAYGTLRRADRRHGGTAIRWPLYALAGAGPGLLLLGTEGLTRTAGARVLDLAGKVSEVELAAQGILNGFRINNALIVLFVGAVTAIIAIGRTLGPAPDDDADTDARDHYT